MVPEIDQSFDIYLPINKKMGNIIQLLNGAICDLTSGEFPKSNSNSLYNARTMEKYGSDVLLFNTSIRNGTILVLLS